MFSKKVPRGAIGAYRVLSLKTRQNLNFFTGCGPSFIFFLAIWVQIYNCLSTELKATWSGIRFKAGRGEGVRGGGGRGEGQVIQGPGSEVLGRKVLFRVLLGELGNGIQEGCSNIEAGDCNLSNQLPVNNLTINHQSTTQQSTTKQPPVNI